ncbi:LOW QUALITY PROTEIN: WAS/WASL-interacting protein family member 2-like [Eleginops maclovinus]|uniref:LOW QUALITY PROTEIN: WAS/WASL-interacting protein family member 2-like n=1 Tax=Eleginops maclovinus TaxID=56733 RepID=UPI003080646D
MPIPPLPPTPGGPPPPPAFSQANTTPPRLSSEEAIGHSALLSDICKGARLRTVSVVNDRSAPMLDSKSQTPPTDHPYIRLYQYLQQPPSQQGAPCTEQQRTPFSLEKPKRSGAVAGGANGSTAVSPSVTAPPIGGLFTGGVPKLRAVGDGSSGRSPSSRAAAPRPPSHRHEDAASPSPQALSPVETSRLQRPSLPNLTPPSPSPSGSMKHSSSAPPPPPPLCRRGNAPSPPSSSSSSYNNREKPLPTNTPPLPSKPPPSPGNSRRPPTSGGNPTSSLAPPPDLPQRNNSLGNKRPAPSPGGHTPTRGPAPLPPPASPSPNRPPPPTRETTGRGAAPPVPAQPSAASQRGGGREAPPPPPYRTHGSPSLSSDPPSRGKPPPPPTRTPAALPPPPPLLRNGPSSSPSVPRSFVDDFESKYSFHPLDDFPPPEEYRHFAKIYPSKANRVMRGAPPLPPVGR